MQNYEIIASDLDGTLLTNAQGLSAENAKAIKTIKEKGVYFVPCTGRTYSEIPKVVKDNEDFRYFIYSNGSVIYDRETETYNKACFPAPLAAKIFDIASEYDVVIGVHLNGMAYIKKELFNLEQFLLHQEDEYFFNIFASGTTPVDDLSERCHNSSDVEMFCCMFKTDDDRNEFARRIAELGGLQTAASSKHNIEVFSSDAGKGNALLRFAKMINVDEKKTIAVGDSINDATMVKAAALGLAMSNAMPALKEVADEIVCSNEEHVAKYILERYIK